MSDRNETITEIIISPNLIYVDGDEKNTHLLSPLGDFFGPGASHQKRVVVDYAILRNYVDRYKRLSIPIVFTLGSFDFPLHRGHMRYLTEAKARAGQNGILIVGLEKDEAITLRKGEHRPIAKFSDRAEMLCHSRYANMIVAVDYDPCNGLSKNTEVQIIQPDVMVVSERNADDGAEDGFLRWLNELSKYCGRVDVLKSQAADSSSERIRSFVHNFRAKVDGFASVLKNRIDEEFRAFEQAIDTEVNRL